MAGLTDKQKAFIDEYLQCFNATEAARRAGYSDRSAYSIGWENLKKPVIANAIEERMKLRTMKADEVLYRLSEHARGNVKDFIGLSERSVKEHPQSWLIKKYKRTVRHLPKDVTEERIEIEVHDPQAALVHIGKHYGLFTERHQVELDINVGSAREKLKRLLATQSERESKGNDISGTDG